MVKVQNHSQELQSAFSKDHPSAAGNTTIQACIIMLWDSAGPGAKVCNNPIPLNNFVDFIRKYRYGMSDPSPKGNTMAAHF